MESNKDTITSIINLQPSEISIDYVQNKTQFQLHTLLTEQRHPKTWNLSQDLKVSTKTGLEEILSVDQDITQKFNEITNKDDEKNLLTEIHQASDSILNALTNNRKVYIYGCGATGRLAKQIESETWKPFWRRLKQIPIYEKIYKAYPEIDFENLVIGELTGGDRALVNSLEGFEDLQIIGQLQLQENQITKGDVVIAVTEGGETSSVIGTILTAWRQYGENLSEEDVMEARKHLYFIYNNPNEVLMPFERSRSVLENNAITKIPLWTGPQAIGGSTRMQASTSEQYLISAILEDVVFRILKPILTKEELEGMQFVEVSLEKRITSFQSVQEQILKSAEKVAQFTDIEYQNYVNQRYSTYLAQDIVVSIFTDLTERSPTFGLFPIDPINQQARRSWIQMFTTSDNRDDTWVKFVGRSYIGLKPEVFLEPFNSVLDPELRLRCVNSLKFAGPDQKDLYDFSFNEENLKRSPVNKNDLGFLAILKYEVDQLCEENSVFQQYLKYLKQKQAVTVILMILDEELPDDHLALKIIKNIDKNALIIQIPVKVECDPLRIRHEIGMKMLMNAHSTAVMTKMGRVVGNTMSNVRAGNLKLIGRATYLIKLHVDDIINRSDLKSRCECIEYKEANALLFETLAYLNQYEDRNQESPVPISIIRAIEIFKNNKNVSVEEADQIQKQQGLETFLYSHIQN